MSELKELKEVASTPVFIECDSDKFKVLDFFNSKNSLQNFKKEVREVRENGNVNEKSIFSLRTKYMTNNIDFDLNIKDPKDKTDNDKSIYFEIKCKQTTSENPDQSAKLDILKKTLKQRLKLNSCVRANKQYAFQTKSENNMTKDEKDKKLDNDIIAEYSKILRMTKINSGITIPSPKDIYSKPNEYKNDIDFLMNDTNGLKNKLPSDHPYIKYFTLIKEKLEKMVQ